MKSFRLVSVFAWACAAGLGLAACGYGGPLVPLILGHVVEAADSGQFDEPTAASDAAGALVQKNPIYDQENSCGENPLYEGKAAASDVDQTAACYIALAAIAWADGESERDAARAAMRRSVDDLGGMADVTALSAALRFYEDARSLGPIARLRFTPAERRRARREAEAALRTAVVIDGRIETALLAGEPLRFGAGGINARPAEGRALIAHELAHVVQQRLGQSLAGTEDLDGWKAAESLHDADALLGAELAGEMAVDHAVLEAFASPGLDSLQRLQAAINTQSQTNNMITNMQKAKHDAMMATIQNAR